MSYKVGSQVVYPAHGVATVVGRTKRSVDGEKVDYLVLSVETRGWGTSGAMTVSVPEARAAEIGVREPIGDDDAAEVMSVLAERNVRVPSNWSRRFKNHQEKMKSGDVYELAEVVRNLANRHRTAQLSTAERSMFDRARWLLISELAVSWGKTYEVAEARVDEVLELELNEQPA